MQFHNYHRPLEIELTIPVRSCDIDFQRIVNNMVYIRWLADLRSKWLNEHFPLDRQIEQGYAPIITGTQIEYKRPIKLFDRVVGRLWISNLGRLKWTVQAEIITNNKNSSNGATDGRICKFT